MSFKVRQPVGECYLLVRTDAKYGLEEGEDPTKIFVNEATEGENRKRNSMFASIERIYDPTQKKGEMKFHQVINSSELRAMEIFLTLSGCNIVGVDGAPLFKFVTKGAKTNVDGTFEAFSAALSTLPSDVVDEIHDFVIIKNPDWGFQGN